MKKNSIIFFSAFIIISSSMAVESEAINVNEKFAFIKEIYSESWALIIGINEYQNVDPLSFAVDDAVAVNDILIEKYGFDEDKILLITDEEATKDNIMNGFQKILLGAKEKDRIVVFYAGHGATYPLPNGGDMGYLIPVEGDASKEKIFLTSISMSTMEELANMSAAKHILYLIDACYGGLTLNTRGLGQEQTPEYLKKMTREKGRQVITAGGKDEVVMEKAEWGHSAFTKNLLQGLNNELADANNDGIISGEELGGFIRSGVAIDTEGQHTPQKGRMGSDLGEFVFISETLEENVVSSSDKSMDDIQDQLDQMAELTQMLLAQAQGTEEINPSGYPNSKSKKKKSKKSIKMKTASTLSWVFPGMGHYYSGRTGKGIFFTGMEFVSVAAILGASNNYNLADEEYQLSQTNMNGVELGITNCDDQTSLASCYNHWKSESQTKLDSRNSAQISRIVASTAAVGIWFWNTRDVKKSRSSAYLHENKFSVGINPYGQVEARINF